MQVNRNVYIVWILLSGLALATAFSSCGTRKSNLATTYSKEKEKSSTEANIASNEEYKGGEDSKETSEQHNDVTTTESVKKYGPDGKLFEDRTTTTVDKSKKSSTSNKKTWWSYKIKTRLDIRTTTYELKIVKTKSKLVDADKTVAKNLGSKWILAGLLCLAIILAYVYWSRKNIRSADSKF